MEKINAKYKINKLIYGVTYKGFFKENDWVIINNSNLGAYKTKCVAKVTQAKLGDNWVGLIDLNGTMFSVSKSDYTKSVNVEINIESLWKKQWKHLTCSSPILKIVFTNDKSIKDLIKDTLLSEEQILDLRYQESKILSEQHERSREFNKYLSHQMRWNPEFWR